MKKINPVISLENQEYVRYLAIQSCHPAQGRLLMVLSKVEEFKVKEDFNVKMVSHKAMCHLS